MLTQTSTSGPQPSFTRPLIGILSGYRMPVDCSTELPAYRREAIHSASVPMTYRGLGEVLLRSAYFEARPQTVNLAVSSVLSGDLQDAMADLRTAPDEADEEGYPLPKEIALSNAKRILQRLYALWPIRFEVHPTPDGEIAVVAPGGFGRSVMVLCDSQGGALCMVNLNGKHRRARYSSADGLPDGFLREALDELKHGER